MYSVDDFLGRKPGLRFTALDPDGRLLRDSVAITVILRKKITTAPPPDPILLLHQLAGIGDVSSIALATGV